MRRDLKGEAFRSFRKSENHQQKAGFYNWLYENDHLRRVLKALIRKRGLQQKKIAGAIKCYDSALANYLNKSGNRRNLHNFHILKLCDYLGVEISINIKIKENGRWREDLKSNS